MEYITTVTSNQLTIVMKREWVLLVYKIPPHPTRLRAQVWRKLQRYGAIYLQNSVCIVPATSELAENMQWIADEELLAASERAAQRADFREEDTEEIIRQFRRQRAQELANGRAQAANARGS